jgi:purine-binding chemotaxis protein CheW
MPKLLNEFQEEDTQHGRFLVFALGKESFGIEINYVTEIIGIQPVTSIPDAPSYVKGIINLRGKIIPVIDMRIKFHKETMEYNDRTCVIVVDISNISVGLIVDIVSEVISISDDNIEPPPNFSAGIQNRYIKGIGKIGNEVKLLLDCKKILTDDEMSALTKAV